MGAHKNDAQTTPVQRFHFREDVFMTGILVEEALSISAANSATVAGARRRYRSLGELYSV